jgi:NAD(P)H-nitrite reductase large subunit
MTPRKYDYVIVGNSAAGVNAAQAIREVDLAGSVAIFSREGLHTYSRPMISYLVAGTTDLRRMYYRPKNFYDVNRVDFLQGIGVTAIDAGGHKLKTTDKRTLSWDKLLLATGSVPFIPPIPGLDKAGYQTFIDYDDAQALIRATRKEGQRVLVIGAGLIGMKAAEAAHARGARVTVVEKMDRILPAALDAPVSAMVHERCGAHGLEVITGQGVAEVAPAGKAGGTAVLEQGGEVEFDTLVVAVGVTPRVELARGAGLELNRGILVDEHLETSHHGIYAAGDVAEAWDLVWEEPRVNALWPNATLQGKYAGWNMAGETCAYPGSQGLNSVEFFGLPVVSAGVVNPPDPTFEVMSARTPGGGYRKVVIRDDILVGMIIAGEVERAGILTSMIQERTRLRRFKAQLLNESFGHIFLPKAVRESRVLEGKAGLAARREA